MSEAPENKLPPEAFRRYDESPDGDFYRFPRFAAHIDEGAIAAVTELYREYFPPGASILDLMSSWVSHLPEEVEYARVSGLGMNGEELGNNPRLTDFAVHDLNENPPLPYGDSEFDGCGICVSVDYLVHPIAVLREVGRVLKPGAPLVITFSNRLFPSKAVAVWHSLDDAGHVRLVEGYMREAGNFRDIKSFDRSPKGLFSDPLYAVVGNVRPTA